jgi:phage repressor protein C with HTH and peptisase S24 domain
LKSLNICHRLREIREKVFPGRGGSARLARAAGMTTGIVSSYERNVIPGADKLAVLARALGCSADWLLRGEGEMFAGSGEAPTIAVYRVGAGHHLVAAEELEPYCVKIPGNLIGYAVDGDSMEPVARHGQVVLALRGEQAKSGDLAVVEKKDGEITFKRVHFQDGRVVLQPVNPSHSVQVVKRSEIARAWKVWGVKF